LPEPYLLLSHKPAISFLTHPWQSNHCSTSDQTQQHDPLIFHSLPTQHHDHATIAHTPQLGQTSTLPGPRLHPRPTNLMLKTFSIKITANADNNLQCHEHGKLGRMHKPSTFSTPFIHGDEVIDELSLSPPLTPGHDLARCYSHSSPPPTIHTQNLGAPHILTTNITNPMPTSCTNAPPNHHAHSGSSHPPTSDGHNLHYQHAGHSLVTHTQHLHQASILSNSSDSAYLKHTAHYYVTLPVRSNFIPHYPKAHQGLEDTVTVRPYFFPPKTLPRHSQDVLSSEPIHLNHAQINS
jgi:hypothetical protein